MTVGTSENLALGLNTGSGSKEIFSISAYAFYSGQMTSHVSLPQFPICSMRVMLITKAPSNGEIGKEGRVRAVSIALFA